MNKNQTNIFRTKCTQKYKTVLFQLPCQLTVILCTRTASLSVWERRRMTEVICIMIELQRPAAVLCRHWALTCRHRRDPRRPGASPNWCSDWGTWYHRSCSEYSSARWSAAVDCRQPPPRTRTHLSTQQPRTQSCQHSHYVLVHSPVNTTITYLYTPVNTTITYLCVHLRSKRTRTRTYPLTKTYMIRTPLLPL